MREPEVVYRERIRAIEVHLRALRKKELFVSFLKLGLLLGGILALIGAALDFSKTVFVLLVGLLVLFLVAALIHGHLIKKRKYEEGFKEVAEGEIRALHGDFLEVDAGEEFVDEEHAFSSDLELFGRRSLFHFLNRTVTASGLRVLAEWLNDPFQDGLDEIVRSRQKAVEELAGKTDFRHCLRVLGGTMDEVPKRIRVFNHLMAEPFVILGRIPLRTAMVLLPSLAFGCLILVILKISWFPLFGIIIVQMVINRIMGKRIVRVFRLSSRNWKILNAYAHILGRIEHEMFTSEELLGLQDSLFVRDRPASWHIKRLST